MYVFVHLSLKQFFLTPVFLFCQNTLFKKLGNKRNIVETVAVIVPDKRSRILEVVIVRRLVTWVIGIWRGEGMGKG
jgi:hypothetical protein